MRCVQKHGVGEGGSRSNGGKVVQYHSSSIGRYARDLHQMSPEHLISRKSLEKEKANLMHSFRLITLFLTDASLKEVNSIDKIILFSLSRAVSVEPGLVILGVGSFN